MRRSNPTLVSVSALFVVIVFVSPIPAFADGCIPYCDVGTIAPTNVFNASFTGDVIGYFVDKGPAGDTDFVRMLDLTTGTTGAWVFDNQTSQTGDMANFGAVNAGDLLVFEIWNQSIGAIFASQPNLSDDGQNHAYATSFSGGMLNGFDFPPGTYIGMEDLPDGGTDWNYDDDTFIVTGVSTGVPEPSSIFMMGSGLLAAANLLRRKLS